MPVSKTVKIFYDTIQPLGKWKPQIGDWVYYSGWIKHWCGFVAEKTSDDQQVKIIRSTMHQHIFTMGPKEQETNTIVLDVNEIKMSRCKYAVDQVVNGTRIWYA